MLVSDNGSIGASSAAVNVNAAQLTMQASTSGKNVYVNDITTGNVTLAPCSGCGTGSYHNNAGATYNLTADSAPSVLTAIGETVVAGSVSVTDTTGTIGTSCTSPFSEHGKSTGVAAVSAYFGDSANTVTISGSRWGQQQAICSSWKKLERREILLPAERLVSQAQDISSRADRAGQR